MNEVLSFSGAEIYQMLPHKYPFLLIDRVYDIIPGKSGYGIKSVTMNEWFFQGHFPGEPIMPGVLIIESLAQLTAMVYLSKAFISKDTGSNPRVELLNLSEKVGYLVKTDIKFTQPVRPGCLMILHADIIRTVNNLSSVRVNAKVNNQIVAEGSLSVSENG